MTHFLSIQVYYSYSPVFTRQTHPSLFLVDTSHRRSLIVLAFEILCLREANAGNKSMTSAMLSLHVTPHDIEYSLYRGGGSNISPMGVSLHMWIHVSHKDAVFHVISWRSRRARFVIFEFCLILHCFSKRKFFFSRLHLFFPNGERSLFQSLLTLLFQVYTDYFALSLFLSKIILL